MALANQEKSGERVYNYQAQRELGKLLFYETSLSRDGKIGCVSCHQPEKAFADGNQVSVGVYGKQGTRHAPSLLGVGRLTSFFWDGRRTHLSDVIFDPLMHPSEHGYDDIREVIDQVERKYSAEHQTVYGDMSVSQQTITAAFVAYIESLNNRPSRFDRYLQGNASSLSQDEKQGLALFTGVAKCATCHPITDNFTDNKFHIGQIEPEALSKVHDMAEGVFAWPATLRFMAIAEDPYIAELGRFVVTLDPRDIGLFRTPSLRNVRVRPPYMHNGKVENLRDAIEREIYWRDDGSGDLLRITPKDKENLEAFLASLTDDDLEKEAFHD